MKACIAMARKRSDCIDANGVLAAVCNAQAAFVNILTHLIRIFLYHRLRVVSIHVISIETIWTWFTSEARRQINTTGHRITWMMQCTLDESNWSVKMINVYGDFRVLLHQYLHRRCDCDLI